MVRMDVPLIEGLVHVFQLCSSFFSSEFTIKLPIVNCLVLFVNKVFLSA